MFGLRNKGAESTASEQVGALDRMGRRAALDSKTEGASAAPPGRQPRLAAAAKSLTQVVAPRLRELAGTGMPAGEVTRQAGALTQIHFRSQGIVLAPLELRG